MNFGFFESLSCDEAKAFLTRFLEIESAHLNELLKQCLSEGVGADFGIESVAPFMRWIAGKLNTVSLSPNPQPPSWIRETESYTRNRFEFDEEFRLLTLRAAYYLGEAFVRSYSRLHWAIGNPDTAEANMPVVAGFQSGLEMAPILVTENLLRRVIADPSKERDIDKALDYWARNR